MKSVLQAISCMSFHKHRSTFLPRSGGARKQDVRGFSFRGRSLPEEVRGSCPVRMLRMVPRGAAGAGSIAGRRLGCCPLDLPPASPRPGLLKVFPAGDLQQGHHGRLAPSTRQETHLDRPLQLGDPPHQPGGDFFALRCLRDAFWASLVAPMVKNPPASAGDGFSL